jgi:hypothetical protein
MEGFFTIFLEDLIFLILSYVEDVEEATVCTLEFARIRFCARFGQRYRSFPKASVPLTELWNMYYKELTSYSLNRLTRCYIDCISEHRQTSGVKATKELISNMVTRRAYPLVDSLIPLFALENLLYPADVQALWSYILDGFLIVGHVHGSDHDLSIVLYNRIHRICGGKKVRIAIITLKLFLTFSKDYSMLRSETFIADVLLLLNVDGLKPQQRDHIWKHINYRIQGDFDVTFVLQGFKFWQVKKWISLFYRDFWCRQIGKKLHSLSEHEQKMLSAHQKVMCDYICRS